MLMYYVSIAAACIVAFIVFRIAKQLIASMRHVDQNILIEFWNGRLRKDNEATYRRVVNHLGNCQSCRDRLDDITQNNRARHNVDEGMITRRF